MVYWLIALSVLVVCQGIQIQYLKDDVEGIKSWYPFCEILKIKIPEKDDFDFKK